MKTIGLVCALMLSGCWGYEQADNQLTGQVKKVHHHTPLFCPNYSTVDVSMGVMRNGVGSMSGQDIQLNIWNKADEEVLEKAAEVGAIVDIKYSKWRMVWCRNTDEVVQYVKVVK